MLCNVAVKHKPFRYNGSQDTELVMVLDCADLDRAADFWCAALGYVRAEDSQDEGGDKGGDESGDEGNRPEHVTYCQLIPADGDGIELLLQRVADPKTTKNRMHIDLRHHDLEAETARLLAAGARHTTGELLDEDGWAWYVLMDPDGNEFCVLRLPTS